MIFPVNEKAEDIKVEMNHCRLPGIKLLLIPNSVANTKLLGAMEARTDEEIHSASDVRVQTNISCLYPKGQKWLLKVLTVETEVIKNYKKTQV